MQLQMSAKYSSFNVLNPAKSLVPIGMVAQWHYTASEILVNIGSDNALSPAKCQAMLNQSWLRP